MTASISSSITSKKIAVAESRQMNTFLPWFICLIGMLFYFYNLFLRVSPSVMKNELMSELHINAFEFGSLAAFYYYAYVIMQLPAGILYDRFGVRLVQFFAILTAVCGLYVFIIADSFWMICCGRFMIGLGGAFAYTGVLKLASNWLAPNRFAFASGLATTFGMSAAICCDLYLSNAVHQVGYRNALMVGLIMGVSLSVIVILFLRTKPKNKQHEPSIHQTHPFLNLVQIQTPVTTTHEYLSFLKVLSGLKNILINRQMWLIGVIACLTYMPASVFLDLWGISYLKEAHALTAQQAANVTSITFGGWIIGGPIIGWISDRLKQRRLPFISAYLIALLAFIYAFYASNVTLQQLYICFFIIGITCSSHVLCFAMGKESNSLSAAGTAIAFTNCLTMLSGVIFQPLVGKLLDLHAASLQSLQSLNASELVYSGADYTFAISIIPLGIALAMILSCFLKS